MKNVIPLLGLLIFIFFSQNALAQYKPSLKMLADEKPWTADDIHRLANWMGIDHQKATFTSKELKGKNYYIVSKELRDGKIIKTDTLIRSSKDLAYAPPISCDVFKFAVMGGKTGEKTLKAEFIFDRFSVMREYAADATNEYSLRILNQQPLEIGKPFYAFANILPYENEGYKYYCAVEGSGKDPEKWGSEFGIKHYILFEMNFF